MTRPLTLPGGARLWITLASLGFVLAALVSQAGALRQLSLDAQGWCWLLLGVGVSLLSLLANGAAWGVALRWLGYWPAWGPVVQLFLVANLRKYLPGGIWHLVLRVQALRRGSLGQEPLATSAALMAVLLDPLLMAAAALALLPLGGWQAGLALLAPLALLLLWPRWLNPLLERLERQRARQLGTALAEPASAELPPGSLQLSRYPWQPLLAELGFVLLRFGGFLCCVQAFDLAYALSWNGWLAGFALAWTAGLVVPAAPGGLGVFEAVLLLRLAVVVPEAPLLAVALSYRLVATLADLIAAATAREDDNP